MYNVHPRIIHTAPLWCGLVFLSNPCFPGLFHCHWGTTRKDQYWWNNFEGYGHIDNMNILKNENFDEINQFQDSIKCEKAYISWDVWWIQPKIIHKIHYYMFHLRLNFLDVLKTLNRLSYIYMNKQIAIVMVMSTCIYIWIYILSICLIPYYFVVICNII